ncbi:LLM class flavin-dependent oxidoreductase [bacterium]|nr:LLM class flavin-dependent oxidoreductase [bacterium]
MEIGLMTEPQLGMTYDEQAGLARLAESVGATTFARSDHYAFTGFEAPHATDAFAALGGLARDTATIGLCVLVSPITFRHPAVIAKQAATIDEMSGGRLSLGVGTGWMEHEHEAFGLPFPDTAERYARLEEALQYLRSAFGKDESGFSGQFYSITDEPIVPLPTGNLPIIVGGSGPKRTPRLAGTYGDEYNLFPMAGNEIRERVERARESASAAGRDPGALTISMMSQAVVGTDETSYRSALEQVAAAHPFGRTAEQIEERLRETGAPVGTPDEVGEAIGKLEQAGVQRIYLQWFGPYSHDLVGSQLRLLMG